MRWLEQFQQKKILVIGEAGIDEYLWGSVGRISPEAPVPVVEIEKQEFKLGMSANVAQNLRSLGIGVSLLTVCGKDADGKLLAQTLAAEGLDRVEMLVDPTRPTLRKSRLIAQKQHVVRMDWEKTHPLAPELTGRFLNVALELLTECDGVIVQDYGKGIWNSDTAPILELAKAKGKPVFVDPSKKTPLPLYRGATLLTPNIPEAQALTQLFPGDFAVRGNDRVALRRLAQILLQATDAEHAVITCGEWGMVCLSKGEEELLEIPTFAREVFDVTGAGDTVIAVVAAASVSGLPLSACLQLGNAAAGIVVGKIGAAKVTPQQLQEELQRLAHLGLVQPALLEA